MYVGKNLSLHFRCYYVIQYFHKYIYRGAGLAGTGTNVSISEGHRDAGSSLPPK